MWGALPGFAGCKADWSVLINQEQNSTLALTKSPPQRGRLFAGHRSGMLVRTLGMRMQGGLDDPGSPVMVFEHVLRWHLVPVHWGRSFPKNRCFSGPQKTVPIGAPGHGSSERILAVTSVVSCLERGVLGSQLGRRDREPGSMLRTRF